jgi:16S rRNA (cytidine1402-2'-O)-methyltransferase
MLYVVATPIGNRSDLSPRAQQVLSQCSTIFCEDTRHSGPFLRELGIQSQLMSLHEHNEKARVEKVLEALRGGEEVALISDAGLPGVCDPGQLLIAAVRAEGLPLTVIPGPCAFVTAWAHLGWAPPFQFVGFLPPSGLQRKEILTKMLSYWGATLFYEAPHRIQETVTELAHLFPNRRLALARELTKKFEEVVEGPAPQIATLASAHPPRGEYVVILGPPASEESQFINISFHDQVSLVERELNLERMQAIKLVANINNVSKRSVYKQLVLDSGEEISD